MPANDRVVPYRGGRTAKDRAQTTDEAPLLTVVGERGALGPLRRDILPLYTRWINDLGMLRTLGAPIRPVTLEAEEAWYDAAAKGDDHAFSALGMHNVMLTVYAFNHAGRRDYEKAGFHEMGRRREARIRLGRAWDEILMDCLATEFESPVLRGVLAPDEP